MALSTCTIIKLSDALVDDVATYITEHEQFFELMMELIPEAISVKLGNIDMKVASELSMCISERLRLVGV